MDCLAKTQAPVMDFFRPAHWLGQCHGLNYASAEYQVGASPQEIVTTLEESTSTEFYVAKSSDSAAKLYFLTPGLRWLDVCELNFSGGSGSTTVKAKSLSTSVCPCSVPLSPFLSLFLFWLIFFDHGANLLHLETVGEVLNARFGDVTTNVTSKGATVGVVPFIIVTIIFAIVVTATVANTIWNDIDELNIVVTVICSLLTALTFLTYFNAALALYRKKHPRPPSNKNPS